MQCTQVTHKIHPGNSTQKEFLPLSITGSSITTHSLLLPREQKPFAKGITRHRALGASQNPFYTWGSRGTEPELGTDSGALSPDPCTSQSHAAHPPSKRPQLEEMDAIYSPNPHPSPKLSEFHYLLPKGGLSHPVGGVDEKTQPNSSHGGTLEGQGASHKLQ